jgi:hypothetical protein
MDTRVSLDTQNEDFLNAISTLYIEILLEETNTQSVPNTESLFTLMLKLLQFKYLSIEDFQNKDNMELFELMTSLIQQVKKDVRATMLPFEMNESEIQLVTLVTLFYPNLCFGKSKESQNEVSDESSDEPARVVCKEVNTKSYMSCSAPIKFSYFSEDEILYNSETSILDGDSESSFNDNLMNINCTLSDFLSDSTESNYDDGEPICENQLFVLE